MPSYNWTRKGSHLPRGSYLTNFNRVLIIPKVQVEDQGEYVCYAFNEKLALQNSVILSIQGEYFYLKILALFPVYISAGNYTY